MHTLDQSRIFNLANLPIPIKDLSDQIDTSRYDLTLDYGNLSFSSAGASMLIRENSASPKTDPLGTRISTTRFMKYGRVTAYFRAAAVPGIVNSFITAGIVCVCITSFSFLLINAINVIHNQYRTSSPGSHLERGQQRQNCN